MLIKQNDVHGGDVDRIAREYGFEPADILDYSANINPLPLPDGMGEYIVRNLDVLRRYPDREYLELRGAIAAYESLSADEIIVGNGATELLYLAARALRPKRVLIPAPSFGDYERVFTGMGTAVDFFPLREEEDFQLQIEPFLTELKKGYQMIILCNPNNPTGKLISIEDLKRIMDTAQKSGIWVILDETFLDFVSDRKKVTALNIIQEYNNLFIVKAFTKFFAVPGLRLGYAIANQGLLARIMPYKEPWSVNALASLLGPWLLKQKGFIKKSREWIHEERPFFLNSLKGVEGLKVFDSKANFVLVKLTNPYWKVSGLKAALEGIGVMIRDAGSFRFLDENYFRLAIRERAKNLRLVGEIDDLLQQYK